jgi:hypothetical protein
MATVLEEATKSLKRIQDTDAQELSRVKDLGPTYNFTTLVPAAERLIALYRQLPITVLGDFPQDKQTLIQQLSDALFNLFQQIRAFNPDSGNLAQVRDTTATQLRDHYIQAFNNLHPLISYSAAKAADFQRLETEGRAAVQSINDRTVELLSDLDKVKAQAEAALAAARQAASEQGVSQQAVYFRDEAAAHEKEARTWRIATIWLSIGLGVYAAATVFIHKWGWLRPADALESTQLITSKILIFAVISYMLILSARNFLSHKHNAIVNRHRQNALMTFNALVAASKADAATDIILTHAAACIFAPQETGYSKGAATPESSLAQAMAGLLAKTEAK